MSEPERVTTCERLIQLANEKRCVQFLGSPGRRWGIFPEGHRLAAAFLVNWSVAMIGRLLQTNTVVVYVSKKQQAKGEDA